MNEELKLKLKLDLDPSAIMSSFCYSYCRLLVDTAKDLWDKEAIFKEEEERKIGQLNTFAYAVLSSILMQIDMDISMVGGGRMERIVIARIILTAESYLKIFEIEE